MKVKNAPLRIYLQVYDDDSGTDVYFNEISHEYTTWCADKINDSDICYIRAGKSKKNNKR